MGSFQVELTPRAARQFAKLPREIQVRFSEMVPLLEEGPRRARPGLPIRKLQGAQDSWRVRIGSYRGIFGVQGTRIIFTRFGHRSNIYET